MRLDVKQLIFENVVIICFYRINSYRKYSFKTLDELQEQPVLAHLALTRSQRLNHNGLRGKEGILLIFGFEGGDLTHLGAVGGRSNVLGYQVGIFFPLPNELEIGAAYLDELVGSIFLVDARIPVAVFIDAQRVLIIL